jgi:hypothetical protein
MTIRGQRSTIDVQSSLPNSALRVQHSALLHTAAHLRIDRARGPAPHKPLLLLAVADLRTEYQQMQPMFTEPPPSFDKVIATLRDVELAINKGETKA